MADLGGSPGQFHPTTNDGIRYSLTLLQLLSNTLILHRTVPYLPLSSLIALGATSRAFKLVIYHTPGVFRRIDLTHCKLAQFNIAPIDSGGQIWRNVQLDENVTEDDFYGGPLRGIFNVLRLRNILQDVTTLILDGLSVTSDLVQEIICHDSFNVRILSIRDVQNLNERKLQQAVRYAIRPSRPPDTPKLQGLYFFGTNRSVSLSSQASLPNYAHEANLNVEGSAYKWYKERGRVITKDPCMEWADIVIACRGIITFDMIPCNGPRHWPPVPRVGGQDPTLWYRRRETYIEPQLAFYVVRGCAICNTSPEGLSIFGKSPTENFPLLNPPPLHSSSVRSAKSPHLQDTSDTYLLARCAKCLFNRYCARCHKWWCEDCYQIPSPASDSSNLPELWEEDENLNSYNQQTSLRPRVKKACIECGPTCEECTIRTELMCKICHGGYCAIHNEGSTLTTCDCMNIPRYSIFDNPGNKANNVSRVRPEPSPDER